MKILLPITKITESQNSKKSKIAVVYHANASNKNDPISFQ